MQNVSPQHARGTVVRYTDNPTVAERRHERASRTWIAQRLAALKRYEYGGEYDPDARYGGKLYFVPNDTLVGVERALPRLGRPPDPLLRCVSSSQVHRQLERC